MSCGRDTIHCMLPVQVQSTIGLTDYVQRDLALKHLIQPLAGEYGMHNGEDQGASLACTCFTYVVVKRALLAVAWPEMNSAVIGAACVMDLSLGIAIVTLCTRLQPRRTASCSQSSTRTC